MTDAFGCDRCGELHEGTPEIRRWETLKKNAFTGYTTGEKLGTAELCADCAERIDHIVAAFIDGTEFRMEYGNE